MSVRTSAVAIFLSAVAAAVVSQNASGQSQAFTYQGELRTGANLAQGLHDLRFELLDDRGRVMQTLCADNAPVTDGRFTVLLDPGPDFPFMLRDLRSIRVLVRPDTGQGCNDDSNFVALSPVQPFTRAPLASRASIAERAEAADSLAGYTPSYFTNAANLTGTLPDASVGSNIPRVDAFNSFSGLNSFYAIQTASVLCPGTGGGLRMSQYGGAVTTLSGAASNSASPLAIGSSVGGGSGNIITDAANSFIGGGTNSSIVSSAAVPTSHVFLGGGAANNAWGFGSVISGGVANIVSREGATIAGGHYNQARGRFSSIGGGGPSNDATPSITNNRALDNFTTVAGGGNNIAGIDDGDLNNGRFATIGGGEGNSSSANHATVAGGSGNAAQAPYSTVGGGINNTASGGGYTTIAGGSENDATGFVATVAGGDFNTASGDRSFIGGGNGHTASASGSAVASGFGNRATAFTSFVGGGDANTASGERAFIGAGYSNTAAGPFATLSGGVFNRATAYGSTVVGGDANIASGQWSSVLGGIDNQATALGSFAGGTRSRALHEGSFVWSDRSDLSANVFTTSTAANQFTVRAGGGVRLLGNVAVSGNLNYTAPRLTYRMYSVGSFVPGTRNSVDVPVRIGNNRELIYGPTGSSITLHIPLDLPQNARIRQIDVYCNDLDATRRMRFAVLGTSMPSQSSAILVETTTDNLSGSQLTVSLPIPTPITVDNTNRSLEFFVQAERPVAQGYVVEWSSSLQLAGMRIGYETDGPSQ